MENQPISEALQLGETLRLKDGSEIRFKGAATLSQLENVMDLYNRFSQANTIQHAYTKGMEDAKQAFEKLLFIATGETMPIEELLSKVEVDDGGQQVYATIHRFCGFKPRSTTQQENK